MRRDRKGFFKYTILLILLVLMIGGCASAPKKNSAGAKERTPSDTVLFREGYAWLGTSGQPADYVKARDAFDRLIRLYPQSKWRSYAETYRNLLDELKSTSDKALSDSLEKRNVQAEIEELKAALNQSRKAYRLLQDKMQADTARLQQENEQLKNDLQRLKRLEIELQRRERSAR